MGKRPPSQDYAGGEDGASGLGLSIWTASLMRGILHGVTPADPATFAAVAGVLLTIALLASVIRRCAPRQAHSLITRRRTRPE